MFSQSCRIHLKQIQFSVNKTCVRKGDHKYPEAFKKQLTPAATISQTSHNIFQSVININGVSRQMEGGTNLPHFQKLSETTG